ncbi:MAG: hypothetical protein ACK4ZO_12605, partial [Cyanobacteriota bacterium]
MPFQPHQLNPRLREQIRQRPLHIRQLRIGSETHQARTAQSQGRDRPLQSQRHIRPVPRIRWRLHELGDPGSLRLPHRHQRHGPQRQEQRGGGGPPPPPPAPHPPPTPRGPQARRAPLPDAKWRKPP